MKSAIFIFLGILSFQISASTLIISDIDDTIKVSHVRSKIDAVRNAFRIDSPFKEMPALFNFLAREISESSFYYVSNAPEWLMTNSHKEFLNRNGFPKGELFLQKKYSALEHKIKTIYNLIDQKNPDVVLLFGDNGENDILFYNEIVTKLKITHPTIVIHQFIHHLYEGFMILSTIGDQVPYITPLGVLSHLYMQEIPAINSINLINFAVDESNIFAHENRNEFSTSFPSWYQCKFLEERNEMVFLIPVAEAVEKIRNICNF